MIIACAATVQTDIMRFSSPPPASAAQVVTYSVVALFVAVILIFTALVLFRVVVAGREIRDEKRKEELRPVVYELLSGDSRAEDTVATLASVIPGTYRRQLEEVLLENARVLSGRESETLAMAFERLGYADEDIENVRRGRKLKRAESAFHLGTMRSRRAVPYLVEALADPDSEVVFSCLNALSKIGTGDAVEAVFAYLSSHSDMETLRVAEVIIERKQSFGPYLTRWLEKGEDDPDRLLLIIDLVGAMKVEEAVPLLLRYLSHNDPAARAGAARALGNIGDSATCDELSGAMDDTDDAVRAETAAALGKTQCEQAIARLAEGLSDPHLEVKMSCAVSLSQLGDEGYAALEEALRAGEELERAVASEVLQREKLERGE